MNSKVGEMTGASSLRTMGCRPSEPAALDGLRLASNLKTPPSVIWMLGILENFRFKSGIDTVSSDEKLSQKLLV